MKSKFLAKLDYSEVVDHYNRRMEVSTRLRTLLKRGKEKDYVNLALGIDDPYGNYSADEHTLGPRILQRTSPSTIFQLALKLDIVDDDQELRESIYAANIPFLKISVGSEMAMLLQPQRHWVANTRSIWSHLLIKHQSICVANEALQLYRQGSQEGQMAYKIWSAVHAEMEPDLQTLASASSLVAKAQGFEPGEAVYIWADAIANALYELHVGG